MEITNTDKITATRFTLSEEWKEARSKIDWMSAPGMAAYVNKLVSGRALEASGHWAEYARREHIAKLAERKGGPLTMLSLGCGSGHIEASLLGEFFWPVRRIIGLEYDDMLRAHAQDLFARRFPDLSADFWFFDFNSPALIAEQFDVVFACHSIHHATDLEVFLPAINRFIADDGMFIGIDYFGPTRFQIEHEVAPIIQELFGLLPDHFRRDLRDPAGQITEHFEADEIATVRAADISESVRSSDLRTLLFANFPVVDMKPMGGTILRWLLQYRAGNFREDNSDHVAIVRLLQIMEREMIASRKIRSDDLFFVLGKSRRL